MQQLDTMLKILREEADAYKALLQLSQDKNRAIIENNIGKLSEASQAEAQLLTRIEALETRREEEIRGISAELALPKEETTLSALHEYASPRQKIQITALKSALSQTIDELARLNETNKMLVDTQLSYINFVMDIITREDVVTNNYTSGGEVEDHRRTSLGFFDQEA